MLHIYTHSFFYFFFFISQSQVHERIFVAIVHCNEWTKKKVNRADVYHTAHIYIILIILYRCKRVTRLNRLTEEKWIRRENERNKTICDVKIAVKERKTFFLGILYSFINWLNDTTSTYSQYIFFSFAFVTYIQWRET